MPPVKPLIATFAVIGLGITLMRLDRRRLSVSRAIWIPLIWLSIAGTRPLSNWLSLSAPEPGYDAHIDGSPLDRNALMMLLGFAAIVLIRRRRQLGAILQANRTLLIFLIYCVASMLWADYPFVLVKRWIRVVGDVGMVCIILTEAHPIEAVNYIFTRMAAVLLPLSVLFIKFFPSLGRAYSNAGEPMWTGVATDKNGLGALCTMLGVALLTRGLALWSDPTKRPWRRSAVVVWSLLGVATYLLVMINSKTALGCFAMASALIVLWERGPRFVRTPSWMTCITVAMIGAVYAILFLGMNRGALSEIGRDSSLTGRTQIWQAVLSVPINPFLGTGFQNFWIGPRIGAVARQIGARLNQAHNGYIEMYINQGFVGLALFTAVVVVGFRNVLESLKRASEYAGLKLAFVFICLVSNFTEASFAITTSTWITFLWAVIRVPARPALNRKRPDPQRTYSRASLRSGGLHDSLGRRARHEPSTELTRWNAIL